MDSSLLPARDKIKATYIRNFTTSGTNNPASPTSYDRSQPGGFLATIEKKRAFIADQVAYRLSTILEPYTLALRRNYNYPLSTEDIPKMTESEQGGNQSITAPSDKEKPPSVITV